MLIEDVSVLIAEDEEELREYLSEYLRIFFKHVYVAKCGHEAYIRYLDKRPDILLSDINMPNLDGLSMISQIRARDKKIKIIVMSAHSEQEKLLHAVELNLVTYLIKPIQTEKLKSVLMEIVETIRSSSERVYLGHDLFWDTKSRTLMLNGEEIVLKEREAMVVQLLASHLNHAVSYESIFYHIYAAQSEKEFSQYAITSLMKRLRSKLPKDTIHNEYGSGYKIISIS